jgi:hypothetical protein
MELYNAHFTVFPVSHSVNAPEFFSFANFPDYEQFISDVNTVKTPVWAASGCGACCGAFHTCTQLTHNSCQVNSCQVNSWQVNSCQVISCRPKRSPLYPTGQPLQTVQPTTASLKATTIEKIISSVYYKLSLIKSGRCYGLCKTQSTYIYRVQSSVWRLPNY